MGQARRKSTERGHPLLALVVRLEDPNALEHRLHACLRELVALAGQSPDILGSDHQELDRAVRHQVPSRSGHPRVGQLSGDAPRCHLPHLAHRSALVDPDGEPSRNQQDKPGEIVPQRTERGTVIGTVDFAVVEKPLELLPWNASEGRQRGEAVDHGQALRSYTTAMKLALLRATVV
jgi:hypothetical protein